MRFDARHVIAMLGGPSPDHDEKIKCRVVCVAGRLPPQVTAPGMPTMTPSHIHIHIQRRRHLMPTREPQDTSLATVTHLDQAISQDTLTGPAPVSIEIGLEPGITIHKEPDLGMPFVVIASGRVWINVGINAGQAGELTSEHLTLVNQLAEGFTWLRDQIRSIAPATAASPDTAKH